MRKRLVEKGLCVCKRELLGLAQELFPRGSVERRPQVDPKLFEYRGFGERRGGARSPLVLSGLVLAGANRQGDEAAPDHGIITAEGLIGLRMEGLELAVLSACETGLGESGGGEGVYGLQRAFHVAGCKNVIASLWKVDDAATQALMTLFYCNLWEKKLDPAEALRQAQLTLYRNPAAVEVVNKRGADFTESDLPEVKPDAKRRHAPTGWHRRTQRHRRSASDQPSGRVCSAKLSIRQGDVMP